MSLGLSLICQMERACLEELGLELGATHDDMHAAFVRLEVKWDPEKCSPNKLKMKEATLARQVGTCDNQECVCVCVCVYRPGSQLLVRPCGILPALRMECPIDTMPFVVVAVVVVVEFIACSHAFARPRRLFAKPIST
jgi:hypothetical protein